MLYKYIYIIQKGARNIGESCRRNSHGVPADTIARRAKEWQVGHHAVDMQPSQTQANLRLLGPTYP